MEKRSYKREYLFTTIVVAVPNTLTAPATTTPELRVRAVPPVERETVMAPDSVNAPPSTTEADPPIDRAPAPEEPSVTVSAFEPSTAIVPAQPTTAAPKLYAAPTVSVVVAPDGGPSFHHKIQRAK